MTRPTVRPSPTTGRRLKRVQPAQRRVFRRNPRSSNPTTQRVAAATNVGAVYKMPTNRISSLPNGIVCIHNKEIIFSVHQTATAGSIPVVKDGTTVALSSTGFAWLAKFADIYDKYVCKSLKLTFIPTLPTTSSGSIAIWFDSDDASPTDTFPVAASNESALVCPIFEQSSVSIPPHLLANLPWYNATSTTTAPSIQGYVNSVTTDVVLLNGAATGDTQIGYVMAEYIVHLKNATSQ